MSTNIPVRVAVIGYGLAGSVFHAPLIAATPGMIIAAIVTANPERIAQAKRDFPLVEIFETSAMLWQSPQSYDLIVVASPNSSHVPLGIAAMRAGIPVVIDKPLTAAVAEAERLAAISRETGIAYTVFQSRRWDGDFLTIRNLIETDQLGSITRFESRFERYRPIPNAGAWRELRDPAEAGGLLYDLGSHLIDQAMQLFGKPDRVYAEQYLQRLGAVVDDDTFVALHFPAGITAHLWMSAITPILGPRFRVMGLRGGYEKYSLDPQEAALKAGMRPGSPLWGQDPEDLWGTLAVQDGDDTKTSKLATFPGAYERFYSQVRDALTIGASMPVDPADTIDVLRVIESAQQSARSNIVVQMNW